MAKTDFQSIDEYIQTFPGEIQKKLQEIREIIHRSLPEKAEEAISYQIPTLKLHGNLVHFAAFSKHIGFYPGASGVAEFNHEFDKRGYKWAKGSVQFPIDQDLPEDLITKIVQHRVDQNLSKQKK